MPVTERVTIWCARRRGLTVAGWALALAAAIAINAAFLGDALSGDEEVTAATDSRRADQLQSERFAADRGERLRDPTEVVVVSSAGMTVDEPPFEQRVRALAAEL